MSKNGESSNGDRPQVSLADHLRRPLLFLGILSAITFVVYSGTLSFGFVWDDHFVIVDNPVIRSWGAVPRAFVSDLWFHASGASRLFFRPLFITWLRLNYAIFGLRTWGWHLGAILLHVVASCMVYILARKVRLDHWTASLAAAIFALHPVHVETTAWISAASDTMVSIFCISAFLMYLKSRESGNPRRFWWLVLSLIFLVLALFAKEMAITFAAVISVYVWLNPSSSQTRVWDRMRETITAALPYGLVTVAYLGLRKVAFHHLARVEVQYSLVQMIETLPGVLVEYLHLLIFPARLTALRYTTYVTTPGVRNVYFPSALLLVLVLLIWYWKRRTGDKAALFFGYWTIITMAPALYLPALANGAFVRDRYIYLPSIGFAILGAKAIRLLPRFHRLASRQIQIGIGIVLLIALGGSGLSQQVYWADEMLLYYRGYSLYPNCPGAALGYANQLTLHGDARQATAILEPLVKQHPDYGEGHYGLAQAYLREGQKDKAKRSLETALQLLPQDQLDSALGMTDLAGFYRQLGDYGRASELCSRVLQQEPDLYSGLYTCALVDAMLGRVSEAEGLLRHATRTAPGQAPANHFLGEVLLQRDRESEAEIYLHKAIELDPLKPEYHLSLGQALQKRGDFKAARQEYDRALKLNPGMEEARRRLAAINRHQ